MTTLPVWQTLAAVHERPHDAHLDIVLKQGGKPGEPRVAVPPAGGPAALNPIRRDPGAEGLEARGESVELRERAEVTLVPDGGSKVSGIELWEHCVDRSYPNVKGWRWVLACQIQICGTYPSWTRP